MEIKYFDQENSSDKSVFLFSGKSGAGIRDMERINKLFPETRTVNRKYFGFIKSLIELSNAKNIIYIHSSPWNIVYMIIFVRKNNYLLVHNPPGFISRRKILGYLDHIILKINILMSDQLLFISIHVLKKYIETYKCKLLTAKEFVNFNNEKFAKLRLNNNQPTVFFFGRYLPYKNIELFYELSKIFKEIQFYIYSEGCLINETDNLKIKSNWISEKEVDDIYKKHEILITPYSETSQSGPFFIGLETNRIIIAPRIPGFAEYEKNENIILYYPNDILKLSEALESALKKCKIEE